MIPEKTVAIIGSGMIASSLAVLTSGNGYSTYVLVRSEASAQRFLSNFAAGTGMRLLRKGSRMQIRLKSVRLMFMWFTSYEELSSAPVIFEGVTEDPRVKQEVYRSIAKACPNVEMIASCTSALTPDMLTEGLTEKEYADRILVAHPFNPVHMVPYVELCKADITKDGLMEKLVELLEDLGRVPVVLKKPTPGFIGNRLQFALFRECMALVEEGVCDYRDIDKALNYSFCPRYTSIGIFEHFDAAGLELDAANQCAAVPEAFQQQGGSAGHHTETCGEERRKEGRGRFYDWRGVDEQAYEKRVNAPYWKFCTYHFPKEPC